MISYTRCIVTPCLSLCEVLDFLFFFHNSIRLFQFHILFNAPLFLGEVSHLVGRYPVDPFIHVLVVLRMVVAKESLLQVGSHNPYPF